MQNQYRKSVIFKIFTVEVIEEYHNLLKKLKNQSPFPNQIHNFCGEFEKYVDKLIPSTKGTPSLYFIDPFGYKGVPMGKIKQILDQQSNEVLML